MDEYTRLKLLGTNRGLGDAALDQHTGGVPMVSCLLNQVFRGNMWRVGHRLPAVGAGEYINLHIHTGAKEVHLHRAQLFTDASIAEADFIRAPTVSETGTVATLFRLNHVLARPEPPGLLVYADSTFADGTVCPCSYLGGGDALGVGTRTGAELRDMPVIMSPETDYVIRLKNLNGADRHFSIQAFLCVEQD